MITDYVNTYAKVIYNDREMTWDVLNSVKNYPVRIGLLNKMKPHKNTPSLTLALCLPLKIRTRYRGLMM